jgi:histone-lysine N-methyltransferase SETMAR
MSGDPRYFNNIESRAFMNFFFPARQGAEGNRVILKETLGEHAPSWGTVKNWVAQIKFGYFSTCVGPCPGRPKTVTTPKIIDQSHELILGNRRISVKSIAEQMGISRERDVSIIYDDMYMRKLSAKWVPEIPERGSKTSTVPVVGANCGTFSARFKLFPVAIGNHGRNLVISL